MLCQILQPPMLPSWKTLLGHMKCINIVIINSLPKIPLTIPIDKIHIKPLDIVAYQHIIAYKIQKFPQHLRKTWLVRHHIIINMIDTAGSIRYRPTWIYQLSKGRHGMPTSYSNGRDFNNLIPLTGYTCSLQIINHIIRCIFSSFLPRHIPQHNQAPFPLTNSIPVLRKAFDIYCDCPKHFLHIPGFPYMVFPPDC